MKVSQLRKKFSAICTTMEGCIDKLESLVDEFEDDEFMELVNPFIDQLTDLVITGDRSVVSAPAIIDFIDNELTEKKDDE